MNVLAHRALKNYSSAEMAGRLLWGIASWFFSLSPRCCYGFRNSLLRLFGARIGSRVRLYPSVRIFVPWQLEIGDEVTVGPEVILYTIGKITIGPRTLISQRAHLCAGSHDYTQPEFPLLRLPIQIGPDVWVASEAFLGPGIRVGEGAVIGARAVLLKSMPPHRVALGNPVRFFPKKT